MASRVQTLRFHDPNVRPATNAHDEGTLYVNSADLQLGAYDSARVPRDLIAIRQFATTGIYFKDQWVVNGGRIYTALRQTGPGPFVETDWTTGAQAVSLTSGVLDLNYDGWGDIGSGVYVISGLDHLWANVPWELVPGITYTVHAQVVNDSIHSLNLLVGADADVDADSTMWSRTGPTWTLAKGKTWRRGGGGPFPLVTSMIPSPGGYKIGQEWFNPATGRKAIKVIDDGGKHLWVEAGIATVVNTNTYVTLEPPIYADGPLDPALYGLGQWWMDTLNSKAKNRYVDGIGDPVWVEMFSFTA